MTEGFIEGDSARAWMAEQTVLKGGAAWGWKADSAEHDCGVVLAQQPTEFDCIVGRCFRSSP